jgi:hypothetical protein
MNNEQHQIIDEVYDKWIKYSWNSRIYPNQNDKDIFIDRIKTEPDFSIHWGLKIEERELSLEERRKLANYDSVFVSPMTVESWDRNNIPTKLITITHKDKTIESHDS